jgi:arylsulfatase
MSNQPDQQARTVLPIPDQPRTGLITYDAKIRIRDIPRLRTFGLRRAHPTFSLSCSTTSASVRRARSVGPCQTPTAERLAADGLKYNRFHTCALCSPTRQALLTGRNHHSVGMGGITEIATGAPGYCSVLPNTCARCQDAQVERLCHRAVRQVPRSPGVADQPGGPVQCLAHRRRRLRVFLRLHRREAHQWYPSLYEGRRRSRWSEPPRRGITSWRT